MVRNFLALTWYHSALKIQPLNIKFSRLKSIKSKMPGETSESQTTILQVCKLSEHALIPTKGILIFVYEILMYFDLALSIFKKSKAHTSFLHF